MVAADNVAFPAGWLLLIYCHVMLFYELHLWYNYIAVEVKVVWPVFPL